MREVREWFPALAPESSPPLPLSVGERGASWHAPSPERRGGQGVRTARSVWPRTGARRRCTARWRGGTAWRGTVPARPASGDARPLRRACPGGSGEVDPPGIPGSPHERRREGAGRIHAHPRDRTFHCDIEGHEQPGARAGPARDGRPVGQSGNGQGGSGYSPRRKAGTAFWPGVGSLVVMYRTFEGDAGKPGPCASTDCWRIHAIDAARATSTVRMPTC